MAKNFLKTYRELKSKHPEAVLLFRCGDFYESYEDDAKMCADILGITLTKGSKTGVSMAGFPYHALDKYLPMLIRKGHRVAICDQLEPPKPTKKRGITELLNPKNNEDMKLNIKNNKKNESKNESKNVNVNDNVNANDNQTSTATEAIEEAVIVEEKNLTPNPSPVGEGNVSKKADGRSKKAKTAASAPHFYLVTYTTKHGGTGSYVMGFKTEQEAKALADNACKTVNSTWRYNDKGEKVYAISLGARYCDIAVRLCDALNKGDKASVSKAIAETHDVYANAVAAGKAEREAKRAELKAQEAKAKAKELAKVKKQNGLYSADDVAAMLKTIEAGGEIPEDIKKLIAA